LDLLEGATEPAGEDGHLGAPDLLDLTPEHLSQGLLADVAVALGNQPHVDLGLVHPGRPERERRANSGVGVAHLGMRP
jgi:hypothetical protein